jgi:hypothetical protein
VKDYEEDVPIPTRLLRLAIKFSSFLVAFVVVAMILGLADCYGWVPHGPWYQSEEVEPVKAKKDWSHADWARKHFTECKTTCRNKASQGQPDEYGRCLSACQEVYAGIKKEPAKKSPCAQKHSKAVKKASGS